MGGKPFLSSDGAGGGGEVFPGRKSKCKGPEVGIPLPSSCITWKVFIDRKTTGQERVI